MQACSFRTIAPIVLKGIYIIYISNVLCISLFISAAVNDQYVFVIECDWLIANFTFEQFPYIVPLNVGRQTSIIRERRRCPAQTSNSLPFILFTFEFLASFNKSARKVIYYFHDRRKTSYFCVWSERQDKKLTFKIRTLI